MSQIRLVEKKSLAAGTMSFVFHKPANFSYTAGQFADFTLVNPSETDDEGNTRTFSLASAPQEEFLMIATRMRDTAFKRVLKNLSVGSPITISKPDGSFVLHDDVSKPAVFLIGGIGITPVRSILIDAAKKHLPQQIVLFFSNHSPADAPFLDELDQLQQKNMMFKLIPAIDASVDKWEGETGFINASMVRRHFPAVSSAMWYLSGPPAMVKAMRGVLGELNVSASDVNFEEFAGY